MILGEQNDVIIYQSKDGQINVALMTRDGNVWLNQAQIATLFSTSKQNVGQHIANILKECELDVNSVVKNYFTTASDGKSYEYEYIHTTWNPFFGASGTGTIGCTRNTLNR